MTDLPKEEVEVISLKYGTAFKKAFHHVDVFCAFVKDVLGIDLKIDKVLQEKEYPRPLINGEIHYDLFAEDVEQKIIVRIQRMMETDFYKFLIYYHMASVMKQVNQSEDYQPDRKVCTIIMLTPGFIQQPVKCGVMRVPFNPIAEDAKKPNAVLSLEQNHQLVFLNPQYVSARTDPKIKQWLDLIADSLDEKVNPSKHITAMLQKVIREIQQDTITPQENAQLKDEWEGQESNQLARTEGKQEERVAVVQHMLKSGLDINFISKITGYPLEFVTEASKQPDGE